MKHSICFGIVLTFVSILSAWNLAYDMGNFRPTDLTEYSLAPNLSHSSSYKYYEKDEHQTWNNEISSLNGALNLEKPGYSLSMQVYGNLAVSYQKNINTSHKPIDGTKYWSPRYSIYSTGDFQRFYNQWFVGGNYFSYANWNDQISGDFNHKPAIKYLDDQTISTNQLSISVGYGRMYQCQEAYLAWVIFDELEKGGCLSRQISSADIDDMALTLYMLRSVHDLDYRNLYRKQLTKLLDYLKSRDYLLPSADTKTTAIILEMWQNRATQIRLVGTTLAFKPFVAYVDKNLSYNYDYDIGPDTDYSESFDYKKTGLELLFKLERPVYNVLQLSTSISGKQGWYDATFKPHDSEPLTVNWKSFSLVEAKGVLVFYPDIRSSVSLGSSAKFQMNNIFDNAPSKYNYYLFNDEILDLLNLDQALAMELYIAASYQLTYKMSVSANLTGTYTYQRALDDTIRQVRYISSGFGITYRLF